ncbi:MAG: hypothetical protein R3264_08520 [Anaerolineae bacterium]|nr:hypothetical protein [Anaerolineae bacterium]
MESATQPALSEQALDQLQLLRVSVLAFQNNIASLPATERNNSRNEQFNQLRHEARSLIGDPAFDKIVPHAVTEYSQSERLRLTVIPRLFMVITIGVLLTIVGLGINSIILDALLVNVFGCVVSTIGILLVIGAYFVFRTNRSGQQLSNYGELYQACEALLQQINHILHQSIPGFGQRPAVDIGDVPSLLELTLDSLNKQAADWQEKLTILKSQHRAAGADAPMELNLNLDYVQRQLKQVKQEINRLNGGGAVPMLAEGHKPALLSAGSDTPRAIPPKAATPVPAPEIIEDPEPHTPEKASANTIGMPPIPADKESDDEA